MRTSRLQAQRLRRRQVITAWLVAVFVAGVSIVVGLNAADAEFKRTGHLDKPSKQSGVLIKPHDFYGVIETPEEGDAGWSCMLHGDQDCN